MAWFWLMTSELFTLLLVNYFVLILHLRDAIRFMAGWINVDHGWGKTSADTYL